MKIQKIIHQTWVGPEPRPVEWMRTWKEKHPDWEYMLWDEGSICRRLKILCPDQFNYYWDKKIWHGIGDIVRYHALYQFGGFQAAGDSICINRIDELFDNDRELFTVACDGKAEDWGRQDGVNDGVVPPFLTKGDKTFDGLVAPIHAATKGHWFMEKLIWEISQKENLGFPFDYTGNRFCQRMIEKYKPDIVLFPRHYFFPTRLARTKPPVWYKYKGGDKIYSEHYSFTTHKIRKKNE
jgi:hypothetical protein